jgi:hypothetical protein
MNRRGFLSLLAGALAGVFAPKPETTLGPYLGGPVTTGWADPTIDPVGAVFLGNDGKIWLIGERTTEISFQPSKDTWHHVEVSVEDGIAQARIDGKSTRHPLLTD